MDIIEIDNASYFLIEKLAEEIARLCIIDHRAPYVEVRVHKPGALRHADSVGLRIERRPEDYQQTVIYVLLGSNINPQENLIKAVNHLRQMTTVLALSPVYRTAPQGYTDQPDFLNMVVKIHTHRTPIEFKIQVIEQIESELGRVRDPNNENAPRTIDLDILLWNTDVLEYGEHPWVIPDPDIPQYAHVAIPLADLAPDYIHPIDGRTLAEIAGILDLATIDKVKFNFDDLI